MTLHLGLSHNHGRGAEAQEEVREARRLLKEKVRNDWEYPPLPAYQKSGPTVAGFRLQVGSNAPRDDVEVLEWKERDYSSDEDQEETATVGSTGSKSSKGSSKRGFKFEGPDSVGPELTSRRKTRMRIRTEALRDEMAWNDGLEHWVAQRDLWCGALPASEMKRPTHGLIPAAGSASGSADSTPRTSMSSQSTHSHSVCVTSPMPIIDYRPATVEEATTVLVPVMPLILPNHPIRRRLSPSMYPEIYTKIILQARTPSVPLNLQNMIEALIRGWKDDGEWPPKAGILEKSIGRKKGSATGLGLRDGVKAVGRVLRITGSDVKEKG